MNVVQRSSLRLASRSRQSCVRSAPRRCAHDDHGAGHEAHGSSSESFGISFYLVVALIPTVPLVYYTSRGANASSNPLSALIDKYTAYTEKAQERNILHTKMVEQAAADRNLFRHARTGGRGMREPEMPEMIASGFSDINVQAGQGTANIEHLVAHYREKQFREEDVKRRLQAEGKDQGTWREVLEEESK